MIRWRGAHVTQILHLTEKVMCAEKMFHDTTQLCEERKKKHVMQPLFHTANIKDFYWLARV